MEKILLVENNRRELDAIARFLKNHGYDILTAADGKFFGLRMIKTAVLQTL